MTFSLKPPAIKLSENDIEAQITGVLRLAGWKVIRLHSGLIDLPYDRGGKPAKLRVGEQGMCDWLAVHPRMHERGKPGVIWFEVKAPGRKPTETKMVQSQSGRWRKRKGQMDYLKELNAAGFCCGWFDSLDGFRKFYRERFEA
jgi:hypothetical protein